MGRMMLVTSCACIKRHSCSTPANIGSRCHTLHYMNNQPNSHPANTSFLTGLRGMSSLCVFTHHFFEQYQENLAVGYGYRGHYGLFRLPVLRLVYGGGPMVALFFVMSGYTVSYNALRLSRKRNWYEFFNVLSSSLFRRGLRLFLPPCISTFMVMLLVRANVYNFDFDQVSANSWTSALVRLPTSYQQGLHWIKSTIEELIIPSGSCLMVKPAYDPHLWTIPLEFRSSILLYCVLLALGPAKPRVRRFIVLLLTLICFSIDSWWLALSLSGMLIAEEDISRLESNNSQSIYPGLNSIILTRQPCWIAILLTGAFIASFPAVGAVETPGFRQLHAISANYRKWWAAGAVQILWAITHLPNVEQLLTSHWPQRLGQFSYALYLVHGPLLQSAGFYVAPFLIHTIGYNSSFNNQLCYILSFCAVTPLILKAAEGFYCYIEQRSVSWIRKLEIWCKS